MKESVVTLDVLHPGVLWGWYITMNLWAKSLATGIVLLAPWLLARPDGLFASGRWRIRVVVPGVAFVFLIVTLAFTVLDLHQPYRFWHVFAYPRFSSVLTLGAWVLALYQVLLLVHLLLAWRRSDEIYDRVLPATWWVAFLSTIYTAGLLGQSNARELWHAATEVPQAILAATLAGSASLLLLRPGHEGMSRWLSGILGGSAALSMTIYVAEVTLAPQKSQEAELAVRLLVFGGLSPLFLAGLSLGLLLPALLSIFGARRRHPGLMVLAGASSLVGLWLVKHAWLVAPQLIPVS